MNLRNLFVLLCISAVLVNSFPIGTDGKSDEAQSETETLTEAAENGETESQEATFEEQSDELKDPADRKKRGMYSSERTEEEIEIGHGVHRREKRHTDHQTHAPPPAKRSADHHRIKRSEGHNHEKRSSHPPEGHVAVMAKDDHGHEKRSTDHHSLEKKSSDDHHGHQKRSTDEHHGHEKRSADEHHGHQKRSEHVEHTLEMHDHQKRNTQDHAGEHHVAKRSGGEGGHRHHRSTDQGLDEAEPDDEIQTDDVNETEESSSRKRRNTDAPLPTFPSDHEAASEHSNSPFE